MRSKIIPRGDRVLIQKVGKEHLVVGKIIKPQHSKDISIRGRIIATGETVKDYQVGDDIIFGFHATLGLNVGVYDDLKDYEGEKRDRGDVLLLNCDNILALIEPDNIRKEE